MVKRKYQLQENTPKDVRRWYEGNLFITAFLNFYAMLIPSGELFVIRTANKFFKKCPEGLKDQLRLLFHQEGAHSKEHKKAVQELGSENLPRFIKALDFMNYKLFEPLFPSNWALSTASAIEHYNAYISVKFLEEGHLYANSKCSFHNMFLWHFCEEIEHKTVVYDLLQEIDPRRRTRFIGLSFCLSTFIFYLFLGASILSIKNLFQWRFKEIKEALSFLFGERAFMAGLVACTFEYMGKDFHPTKFKSDHVYLNQVSALT